MSFIVQTESNNFGAVSMNFKLDAGGTSVLFLDFTTGATLEVQSANTIQAIANDVNIRIQLTGGEKILIDALELATININGVQVTQVQATAINELNSLFANIVLSGAPPIITSGTTINSVVGANINYVVTSDPASPFVAINWDFSALPAGHDITVINSGNHTTLIGSTDVAIFPAGSYNLSFTAVNYYGSTIVNLTLIKTTAFVNSLSFSGAGNAWMLNTTSATYNTNVFHRPNGTLSVAADAWTASFWVKTNFTGTASQTYGLMFYGTGGTSTTQARLQVTHETLNSGVNHHLNFRYGVFDAYINAVIPVGVANNTWFHVMMTYNGDLTNTFPADYSNYLFYVNGALVTPTWSNVGPGLYYSPVEMNMIKVGTATYPYDLSLLIAAGTGYSWVYAPNTLMEEFATWNGTVLTLADAVTLYNSGAPFDINALFTPLPYTYFRCGDDGDVAAYPVMSDNSIGGSGINLDMQGGTVVNYVSDVP